MQPFFDRRRELSRLERLWAGRGAQLVTLWGRRRVGKSALLSRFAEGKRAIYLYGTRLGEREVLEGLSLQAADSLGDSFLRDSPFDSWDAALTYVADRAQTDRLLVILDEFPYLCDVTTGLDTLVQRWWDRVGQERNVMVVLAGSAFSFMEGLTGARGPLHGRRTGQIEVHPFDHYDSAQFFRNAGPTDRVRAYACFGGIPAYARHWDTGRGLVENVQQTLLAPDHVLFREGQELLRTEFHQEALYASILRAVSMGEERPSDIARAVGRQSVDQIFDHIRRLQDMRFLRREVPVTEWDRLRTQRVLYRLDDPYLRFWFRYVVPYQSLLQLDRGVAVWEGAIAPTLDVFVARTAWEEVCRQHLWRRAANGTLPVSLAQLGRWWDGDDEVDLVGLWHGEATVVGECKWTAAPVGEGVLADLQHKAKKLPLHTSPLWVLASRSGFDPIVRRRAEHGDLLLIEPSTLFDDEADASRAGG